MIFLPTIMLLSPLFFKTFHLPPPTPPLDPNSEDIRQHENNIPPTPLLPPPPATVDSGPNMAVSGNDIPREETVTFEPQEHTITAEPQEETITVEPQAGGHG